MGSDTPSHVLAGVPPLPWHMYQPAESRHSHSAGLFHGDSHEQSMAIPHRCGDQ